MSTDALLSAAVREYDEYMKHNAGAPATTPASTGVTPETPRPSKLQLEHQDMDELMSSEIYATLDLSYHAPRFPIPTCSLFQDLKKNLFWCSMLFFAYYKGVVLNSDTLDAHVRWMRDIIAYLRESHVLPAECTSERATTRIITALAHQTRFRQHMRNLRAASIKTFPDLLADVGAYICYNHDSNPYERRRKRRVFVPAVDEPTESGPSKRVPIPRIEPSACDPPPFKARLHRSALEGPGEDKSGSRWGPVLFNSWRAALKLKEEEASGPQRRLGALQAILRLIKEQKCTETPYFDDLSEEKLRDVLEKDAGFTAVMDELLRTADGEYGAYVSALRRIVNHLCQPRQRAHGGVKNVRFAPF
ncbi:hypothetical protein AURDEDRAFT_186135 [Auricularia subglabra TFB-10046 SS5]|nr:hypothetical protein AURDEDRAFT_186135 [Auricularia subglabra TFB-10046 SS5]